MSPILLSLALILLFVILGIALVSVVCEGARKINDNIYHDAARNVEKNWKDNQ